MTLLACQIFSTIAHEGSFARTAEQLHLTPSAISHAVSTMEAECGFPLLTRTKSGVTMTAAAENLLPAIQRLLASSESLDQSIAQINGMHKGVLRLGVFNSACVTWQPQLVPQPESLPELRPERGPPREPVFRFRPAPQSPRPQPVLREPQVPS